MKEPKDEKDFQEGMTPEESFDESVELVNQLENLLADENAEVPEPTARQLEDIGRGGDFVRKQSAISPKIAKYFAEEPVVQIGDNVVHPKLGGGIVVEASKIKGENSITVKIGSEEYEYSGTDEEIQEFFKLSMDETEKGDVVNQTDQPDEDLTVEEVMPDGKVKVKTPAGEEKVVDKEFVQKKQPMATITKKAQVETMAFEDFWQIGAVPGIKSVIFDDFIRFIKNELPYINIAKTFDMTVHDLQEKNIFAILQEAFDNWKGYTEELPPMETIAPVEEPGSVPAPAPDEPSEEVMTEIEETPADIIGASKKKTAKSFSVPEEVTSPEQASQLAIEWQRWVSEQSLSYGELAEWESYFSTLAQKFNLVDEFVENGIIGTDEKEASKEKTMLKKAQDPNKPQKYAPQPEIAKTKETEPKMKEEPNQNQVQQPQPPQQPQPQQPQQGEDVSTIADRIIETLLLENPQAVVRKIIELAKGRPDVISKLDSIIPDPKFVPWTTKEWQKVHGHKFARRILSAMKLSDISVEKPEEGRERDIKRNRILLTIGDESWHITQEEAYQLIKDLQRLTKNRCGSRRTGE